MSKLLLVIDYQYDFVASDGRLTAGLPAQAIEQNLIDKINSYIAAGQNVLCTLDTHIADVWSEHPEGSQFDLHCEKGTAGWELYGELAQMMLNKVEKTSYMLSYQDIDRLVKNHNEIELAGVTTDICVLQNAIGLYNHAANTGRSLHLICDSSCVASFDQAGHDYALEYMKMKLGVEIIV